MLLDERFCKGHGHLLNEEERLMTEFNLRISSRFGMVASAGLLMLSGQAALAQTGGE